MVKDRLRNIALCGWLTALGGMVNYVAMIVLFMVSFIICIVWEQNNNNGIPNIKGLLIDITGPAISIIVFLLKDWINNWQF